MAYPKEILAEARATLGLRHEQAVAKQNSLRLQIASKLPQALTLEREIHTTSARLSAAMLSGVNVSAKVETIREFNITKREELSKLLISGGFAPNALDPSPFCSHCNDSGLYNGGVCTCLRELQKELMYARLGAQAPIDVNGFKTFDLSLYPSISPNGSSITPYIMMTQIFKKCVDYSDNFSLSSGNLLFSGASGLGKTHLSLAIGSTAITKGFDVLYIPFHALISQLESARFGKGDEGYRDCVRPVLDCELLILDDLGSEFSSPFGSAALYEVINTRLLKNLPTIISTNLTDVELSTRYSERISSRILGCYQFWVFKGKDIRIKKSLNN